MGEKQVPIKVDEKLKAQFEWACAQADTTSSQQLRKHMRSFVADMFDKLASSVVLETNNPRTITGAITTSADDDDAWVAKRMVWLMRQFESLHPEVHLLPFEDREEIKLAARARLDNASLPIEDHVSAYLDLMRAYFMRSAIDSLRPDDPLSYTTHPGFDEYARHYVKAAAAEGDQAEAHILAVLKEKFPLDEPSCMTPGSSYWKSGATS